VTAVYIGYLVGVVTLAAQTTAFLTWFFKHTAQMKINNAFIEDIATCHIPYIHSALQQIARAKGIDLAEPPNIKWVQMNGEHKVR
jgi:hypothetical protein